MPIAPLPKYVDRFFAASFELTSIQQAQDRDGQSLFTFLEALHSLADRFVAEYGVRLHDVPEFVLLGVVRNYMHHVGDLTEFRLSIVPSDEFIPGTSQQIIIAASQVAASIANYRSRAGKSPKRRDECERRLSLILEFADCEPLLSQTDQFVPHAKLKLDGRVYDLGYDLFKAIYNVTNVVADICRETPSLCETAFVQQIDTTVTASNNLPKYCLTARAGVDPILTTRGFVVASRIERA
ncbi:MAG: hypothetical protein ACF8R9_06695 [Phycisphaerales bacterium JB054]